MPGLVTLAACEIANDSGRSHPFLALLAPAFANRLGHAVCRACVDRRSAGCEVRDGRPGVRFDVTISLFAVFGRSFHAL